MKVKELIEKLQQCNPDDLVILAKDIEGNGYSPAGTISEDMYTPESTWSGEVSLRELTSEDEEQGFTSEDVGSPEDGAVNCITIYPVN